MISKRIVFWVSFLLSLIFAGMLWIDNIIDYCHLHGWCLWLMDLRSSFGIYLVIFPVIFFFSLITYWMRDEVFKTWFNFSIFYIPLFVLFSIFLMNNTSGGGYIISGGYFAALILFFFLALYFLISLILITVKYILLRRKQLKINFPQK